MLAMPTVLSVGASCARDSYLQQWNVPCVRTNNFELIVGFKVIRWMIIFTHIPEQISDDEGSSVQERAQEACHSHKGGTHICPYRNVTLLRMRSV